jgi:sec-independent protein translocase protein TatB
MFGIGIGELLLIAIVALVLVGPKKLPDLMRQGGKFFVQLRRTANDVKATFDDVIREAENELRQQELAQLREVLHKQDHELKSIDITSKDASVDGKDQLVPHGVVGMSDHDPHHDPHHAAGDGTQLPPEVSSPQNLDKKSLQIETPQANSGIEEKVSKDTNIQESQNHNQSLESNHVFKK